jgi:putative ABC transport system permease protein
MSPSLWLRWSWRDLRARWLQVIAIALVVALGTGSYAGLSSVTQWRRISTDAAYQQLNMHDLRIEFTQGAAVPEGSIVRAAGSIPSAQSVVAVEERLIVDLQVDASTAQQAILVPGKLYGSTVGPGRPAVDAWYIAEGRSLDAGDGARPTVLLELHFAKYYKLPPEGDIRISGGRTLNYVGHAITPEYFIVTTERGGLISEANFAAVFSSVATAQELAGTPGMVNDAVFRLTPGADEQLVMAEIAAAVQAAFPGQGFEMSTRAEDPAFRLNDADIDGDQQVYDIFAFLIFGGAVVAAFNLITRVVESQRREIGIAMVLGLAPHRIALRPLLLAAEIALLGVLFGIGVGVAIGQAMASVLKSFQPLPRWDTSFQFRVFLGVGAAGFLVPFLATSWPVWRAVSVAPIEAIRPAYRSFRGGGFAPFLRWLRLPGGTFAQMPVRNLVRSPRRSLLTAVGIAAAIAALVAFVGLIDSFIDTIDRGDAEILGDSPQRMEVELTRFFPVASPQVEAVMRQDVIGEGQAWARVDGIILANSQEVGVRLTLLPLDNAIWAPSIPAAQRDRSTPGVYLSDLAARNLQVDKGDVIVFRHPRFDAAGAVALVETPLPVLGTHPHPFRFVAYMDQGHATLFGLEGATNLLEVLPAGGATRDDVKRALFTMEGVSSTEGVGEQAEAFDKLLSEFVTVLRVIEGAMLLLALLIAFNSASINMDERVREHATMFAFGVPVRTALRIAVVEHLLLGIFASAAGILGGWYLLKGIVAIRIPETLPDIDVVPALSPLTVATALGLGIGAVAVAPLLTWRRLARMDVASALKVIE